MNHVSKCHFTFYVCKHFPNIFRSTCNHLSIGFLTILVLFSTLRRPFPHAFHKVKLLSLSGELEEGEDPPAPARRGPHRGPHGRARGAAHHRQLKRAARRAGRAGRGEYSARAPTSRTRSRDLVCNYTPLCTVLVAVLVASTKLPNNVPGRRAIPSSRPRQLRSRPLEKLYTTIGNPHSSEAPQTSCVWGCAPGEGGSLRFRPAA